MNSLIEKVAGLLPDLETKGEVYLYGLGEKEDVNRWDVILSADWSDKDYIVAVKTVADALTARLEPRELVSLAGVVVIPSTEPNIVEMPRSIANASPEEAKIVDMTMLGLDVRRMFVFKAQPPQRPHLTFNEITGSALLAGT